MTDPEETREETASRRINKAAEAYATRCEHFTKTLRNNGRGLSPAQRDVTKKWLDNAHATLIAAIDQGGGIPPLGLVDFDDD